MTSQTKTPVPFEPWTDGGEGRYLHGTKADLAAGDLVEPGRASNYGARATAAFVYMTNPDLGRKMLADLRGTGS